MTTGKFIPKEMFAEPSTKVVEEVYSYRCTKCGNEAKSRLIYNNISCPMCCTHMKLVDSLTVTVLEEPPKGSKFDQGKPRWGLLPWAELETVVEVLTMGAAKYSDDNWKHVESFESRYRDALMRHFSAHCKGETKDPESGKSHLAHAVCCALFLMWKENQK